MTTVYLQAGEETSLRASETLELLRLGLPNLDAPVAVKARATAKESVPA